MNDSEKSGHFSSRLFSFPVVIKLLHMSTRQLKRLRAPVLPTQKQSLSAISARILTCDGPKEVVRRSAFYGPCQNTGRRFRKKPVVHHLTTVCDPR